MKNKTRKALIYLVAGFVVLFCSRLLYGYINPAAGHTESVRQELGFPEFNLVQRNYAATLFKAPTQEGKPEYSVDQKYERVASIQSRTDGFDRDQARIREVTDKYHGLVEYEQSAGLAGNRRLDLAIGVVPAEFDNMVAELKGIGKLSSIRVDKTDKTSEYRGLMAKKVSLEKTRDSLQSLKGKAGRIDEMINLENRLLEIEDQLQTLGVTLGEYSQENQFCTAKLSLREALARDEGISLLHRVRVALRWTVIYYLISLSLLLAGTLLALSVVTLLEKLRWISTNGTASSTA
ncbi:MAG TPA: DUF4349 domain-containing protein [Blastocatellia bacterium]|nr:DUF4349 domain-containing protein [Blastocatellia bacterium]